MTAVNLLQVNFLRSLYTRLDNKVKVIKLKVIKISN